MTEGCTHNSCTFCNMYHDIPFRMLSLSKAAEYLQEVNRSDRGIPCLLSWQYGLNASIALRSSANAAQNPRTPKNLESQRFQVLSLLQSSHVAWYIILLLN